MDMQKVFESKNARALTLIALASASPAAADLAFLEASRDNTLYESTEGALSDGSGVYLFLGRTKSNGVKLVGIDGAQCVDE